MMNGQLMELWGNWLSNALRGQNQIDLMKSWWSLGFRDWSNLAGPYAMMWGVPSTLRAEAHSLNSWHQLWEAFLKMQELCMQWAQMVPRHKYDNLSKRAEELEGKIREQAKTIDRLRNLLNQAGSDNNIVVSQLQDLIGQQSEQFKQMTQSVSDYIKSSAEKVASKK